jgi:hypothetical protein
MTLAIAGPTILHNVGIPIGSPKEGGKRDLSVSLLVLILALCNHGTCGKGTLHT